jgi:deoxyhypusine synthase
VLCLALTDGSTGDMLHFHRVRSAPEYSRIDIVEDVSVFDTLAIHAKRVGMIILGGGLVKHYIANACLMRNGGQERGIHKHRTGILTVAGSSVRK